MLGVGGTLDQDRLAWYRFNETSGTTAANSAGPAASASLVNGPVWTSGALSFDGVNDHVQTPVTNGTSRTLAAWIYPRSSDPVGGLIESVFDCDVPGNFGSGWGLNNLFIWVILDDTIWNSGVMITRNQWQHVCVTFNSSTVRVYLDGVLKGSRSYTQGPVSTTATYKIGRSNANNLFFHGDIRDAKIYSRIVTDLEVITIQSTEAVAPDTAPTGLAAAASAGCVSLSWQAPNDGETWFTVQRSLTPGGPYSLLASNVLGTRFADVTAAEGTPYYYVVAAGNIQGTGPNSAEASATPTPATTYYIDPAGDDSNNGTSLSTPWKSISKVNSTTFKGGDQILFKRGGTWTGTLSPQGSGTIAAQITLGSYGIGAKPLISGAGAGAAIAIHSQSYWTIDGFEVTNQASGAGGNRCGIRVGGGGDGSTIRRIRILNNDVHDIHATPNVNDGARNWGGIFVWIDEPGKADDVLIQGNTVTEIQGQGISFWGEFDNNYFDHTSMNYNNCSPNVVVRGNRVWRTSGDGILLLGTENELAEYNQVGYAGILSGNGNNIAAAWPTRHRDGIWQYNHVHHTKWLNANDSTAFDNDGYVYGTTIFQYNYTHDNEGGFNMEYYWTWDYGLTVSRYNLSVNDGRNGNFARVYFSNRPGSLLYNNVFYNPGMLLDVSNGGANTTNFHNNIFVGSSRTASFDSQGVFFNNHFFGGVTATDTANGNVTQDPRFVNPNVIHNLTGFILQSSSPCRNAGQVMSNNGGKDFWGVALPTTAPHRGASQINNSSGYTSSPSYVKVSGPFSVMVPFSGGSAATFTANVHDQNFRPMTAPPVTWSLSPSVAGCSISPTGVLTLSNAAAGQRFAVTATSGTGSHTFSFSTTAPVWTNSAGTGIWNTTDANWSGLTWADGGDATFAHSSAAENITISGTRSADDVKIGNRTNNANYTFTGGSLAANTFTLQGETSSGPTVAETNLSSTNVTTSGRLDIGRARLIASGNTTLTADTIGSSGTGGLGDWGFLRIQDNAIVTATNGLSGDTTAWGLELNGGTLITRSLWAAPWSGQSRLIFNGTQIKANADNPNFITLQPNGHNDPPVIYSGGARFDTDGYDIGIGVTLQGSGGLTKIGAGTLTLSGAWSYTGPTSILGGTLTSGAVAGTSHSLSALTLNGGTLAATNPGAEALGNFQLRGDVSIGESGKSLISADVRVVAGENRTFTVAATGDPSGIDLLVTGRLGHHNGFAWGFATKTGDGVMKISGANELGSLTVNAGKMILENSGIGGMWNGGLVNHSLTELDVTGSNAISFGHPIQGSGTINKTGSGTLELTAVNSHTGGTIVNEGKLILATGNASGTGRLRGALTINPSATVETTGDGTGLGWLDQISSVTIDGGALTSAGAIHVWNIPGGITMTGGLLQSNSGTSNPNGPQLEWNRTSVTTLASTTTATIAGRIRMRNDNSYPGITFDVAEGAAATDLLVSAAITEASGGLGITKSGPGTMMLTGSNNYTGQTMVTAGTLRASGSLGGAVTVQTNGTLSPGASIGTLSATSATLEGKLAIELDGTEADRLNLTGNLNISNATLAISGSLTAAEYIIASYGDLIGPNFAAITGLPSDYTVDYSGNQIRLVANPTFSSWIETTHPALSDKTATADPDFDGIPNVLEYILGGDPSQPNSAIAPTITTSGGNLVFTFNRSDASETADITLIVEAGTNLTQWPETYIVSPGTPTAGVLIQENQSALDTITVTIPQGTKPNKFARLRAIVVP